LIRSEDIYQVLFEDEAFEALPQMAADLGGGRSAMLFWIDAERSIATSSHSHFTPEFLADYEALVAQDPWVDPVKEHAPFINKVMLLADLVSDYGFERRRIYDEVDKTNGLTSAEIAAKRGVTYYTIKTQMKAIAAKVGQLRQLEIAATVAGLPRLALAPADEKYG
jgi:hypothetical protein